MAVYMIRSGTDGDVKIGLATDPLKRLKGLQTSNTTKLRLIRVMEGGREEEKALHARFQHLRRSGEWFAFAAEMLAPDIGFADLPIPVGKRAFSWPDNAYGKKRALHEDILNCLGGPDAIARRLGVAPWVAAQWDGVCPPYYSAVVLLMRDAGYRHVTLDALLGADRAEREQAAAEAGGRHEADADRRASIAERNWVEKHGAGAAWWTLRREHLQAPVTDAAPEQKAA